MTEILILGTKGFSQHQQPLLDYFGSRIEVESDYRPKHIVARNPDMVISLEASNCQRGFCVAEAARQGIATLQIMDGITEWRNTWTRRVLPYQRPLNQPVVAHKVACLGRLDARLFESWGNVGKCEIIGQPRLDKLIKMKRPMRVEPIQGRHMRLMIMTARTPGFTPEEVAITTKSLRDLKDYLESRKDIQVTWRITKGLHKQLNVQNTFTEATGKELHEALYHVDAVITTPSTTMLEGMLFGHPVALLNYHNTPMYVPAAWQISARDHIEPVLEGLRSAPLEYMLYQDYCLHDALACRTPALPRLVQLIETMIEIKRECDANGGRELTFPHRILDDPEEFVAWPSEQFDLGSLYPDHPVFGRRDLLAMQSELDAALGAIEQVKEQAEILSNRLYKIPGYGLAVKTYKMLQKRFA